MQARLIVKNFGPIEEVDLDLRNVNVFIGPQASGKSALAKIYTICKSPLSFLDDGTNKNLNGFGAKLSNADRFKKILDDYNVGSFLNDDTYVSFSSELHDFEYSRDGIKYDRKIFKKIGELEKLDWFSEDNRKRVNDILVEMYEKMIFFRLIVSNLTGKEHPFDGSDLLAFLSNNKSTYDDWLNIVGILKHIENNLSLTLALYIPSERNFVTIIKGASLNLQNNNVPIPKHILSFGAEYETASSNKKELDLGFLKQGLFYKNEDGLDKIFYSKTKSIKLIEAASGIQSIVPLLLPILSDRELDDASYRSFVIEEPELNLFPRAQYELIKVLEKERFYAPHEVQDVGTVHIYTTHSPYVLSAFNNLLYSNKVITEIAEKNRMEASDRDAIKLAEDKVEKILPTNVDPQYFSAYQIFNGKAESIFNRDKGLIEDNYIDEVTDKMGDDFDALMELMEEA